MQEATSDSSDQRFVLMPISGTDGCSADGAQEGLEFLAAGKALSAVAARCELGPEFDGMRQEWLKRACEIGLPGPSQELWRFSSPQLFGFEDLIQVTPHPVSVSQLDRSLSIPKGVETSTSINKRTLELIAAAREVDCRSDSFSWLQLAYAGSCRHLSIAAGEQINSPLYLTQTQGVSTKCQVPLVVIDVGANASVKIYDDLFGEAAGLLAPVIEVFIGPNANVEFVSLQHLPGSARYCARHRFHLMRDAQLTTKHLAVGAAVSRCDLDCRLVESGADANLFGLYLASGERRVDFHTTQNHLAPHCRSNLYFKGALKDHARSVYYGYIRVADAAQKTDAYQTNRNLVLSAGARADSIPNLEIKANDVKCSHGASVSEVGAEELFYLMARGVPRESAEKLLVEGFFDDILAKVKDDGVRERVRSVVFEALRESDSFARRG